MTALLNLRSRSPATAGGFGGRHVEAAGSVALERCGVILAERVASVEAAEG
jgi:hypothetical protein